MNVPAAAITAGQRPFDAGNMRLLRKPPGRCFGLALRCRYRMVFAPVLRRQCVAAPFARALLGWKRSSKNKLGWSLVPNFADVDNAESMRIGAGLLDYLHVVRGVASEVPKDPGGPLDPPAAWPSTSTMLASSVPCAWRRGSPRARSSTQHQA